MKGKKAVDAFGGKRYNKSTVAIRRRSASRRENGVVCRRDVRREGKQVSEVHVNKNESLESALKRFKRQCARAGVLAEVRKREHYEKPSVKRKKKAEAARKRKY